MSLEVSTHYEQLLKKIVYRYINMQYCIVQMHFAKHCKMLHCSVFCKGSSDLLVHLMGFSVFLLYHKNFIFKSDFCHHGFNVGLFWACHRLLKWHNNKVLHKTVLVRRTCTSATNPKLN